MSPDTVHRVQRLRPDPVGARRDHRRLQRPGCPGAPAADGATIANIFLGHITNWNDPAIAALNPGATLPEPEDHAGLPVGRLGHVVQLQRLPLVGLAGVEDEDRRLDAAGLPGRRRREGLRRCRGSRQEHAGRRDLRRRRLRAREPHPVRSGQERRREVPLSQHPADRRRGAGVPDSRPPTTRCTS